MLAVLVIILLLHIFACTCASVGIKFCVLSLHRNFFVSIVIVTCNLCLLFL